MTPLLVALGAGLGASLRFILTTWFKQHVQRTFPWATLIINLFGSFLLGLLVGLNLPTNLYQILGIGLMGGFTTFSTFNVELLALSRNHPHQLAPYAFASYLGGPVILLLGLLCGKIC